MKTKKYFTSESVTEGHPDKLCDQISDAILDDILKKDENGRVACETCCTTGLIMIMGEISTSCYVNIPQIARKVLNDIGYRNSESGFDGTCCSILTTIDEQSEDIALGVDCSVEAKYGDKNSVGAGDQGIMFGYACNETPEYMPLPIMLAHRLARRLDQVRKDGILKYLRPDGKTQVTVEYIDNIPSRIDTIVISAQHSEDVSLDKIQQDLKKYVINEVIDYKLIDSKTKIYINPTGRFVIGGPHGDSGLTGRKIIVDTYGGMARHGGGAFSGKDPTKVDRSAAYAARYIAKNIVAAQLADRCEVQLAYAIGIAQPVSILIDTFGTGKLKDEELSMIIQKEFDLSPANIIQTFELKKPIYQKLAVYGHMGREDLNIKWEELSIVNVLKKYLK